MTDRNRGWTARLTRLLAGVVGGEPNAISSRPLNQSDDEDLANAWTQLHRATPPGWAVEQPSFDPGRRQWELRAFDAGDDPKDRRRRGDLIVNADSEIAAVLEMERALRQARPRLDTGSNQP